MYNFQHRKFFLYTTRSDFFTLVSLNELHKQHIASEFNMLTKV